VTMDEQLKELAGIVGRLAERHEGLATHVELLATDLRALTTEVRELTRTVTEMSQHSKRVEEGDRG